MTSTAAVCTDVTKWQCLVQQIKLSFSWSEDFPFFAPFTLYECEKYARNFVQYKHALRCFQFPFLLLESGKSSINKKDFRRKRIPSPCYTTHSYQDWKSKNTGFCLQRVRLLRTTGYWTLVCSFVTSKFCFGQVHFWLTCLDGQV